MKKNVRPPAARQRLQANAKAVKVNSPRNLTPALCDRLRLDLLNACRKVAETHGLTVEGGELSDIDLRHGFDIEFSVGIPMDDGSLYSVDRALFEVLAEPFGLKPSDRALFEVLAEPFGLKPSDYGRIFRTGGETFRITAINPNRPKYPISVERLADGRGYKFTVENIEMYLKAAEH